MALGIASASNAALPSEGVLVPGVSLGGVSIGMSKTSVRRVWGDGFGRCRRCLDETWYFTYRPFEPQGAGAVFRRNRVVHVFTLWQPDGWRTNRGLELGATEAQIIDRYGTLRRQRCIRYDALLLRSGRGQTAFYVYKGKLWGFGLMRPRANPCL